MSEVMYKRRALCAQSFFNSEFYKIYFEPEIERLIEKYESINFIKADPDKGINIEMSYYQNKIKRDAYKGLLAKFKEWAKEENKQRRS